MTDHETGAFWEENAEVWTALSRQGWDLFRDRLNTPAFFEMLPDVSGLRGLDLGCGEGHNTRLLAARGAGMTGIDIAPAFLKYAGSVPSPVRYAAASAQRLPFGDGAFDFATAFMSLMDMPQPEHALGEAARVLRTGGFLQFSIPHPCFETPHRRHVRDAEGKTKAMEVGGYFDRTDGDIDEWIFRSAPPEVIAGLRRFRIPRFLRTVSDWINMISAAGLCLEQAAEPRATDEDAARFPKLQGTQVVPYFLHLRCRKKNHFGPRIHTDAHG